MVRIPQNRRPTHPGEMLNEEFLKPLGLTQVDLAKRIGVSFQRVNQIVRCKRAVSPDTALRLGKLLGTTPGFWLGLQQRWDLHEAMHSADAKIIGKIKPITRKAG